MRKSKAALVLAAATGLVWLGHATADTEVQTRYRDRPPIVKHIRDPAPPQVTVTKTVFPESCKRAIAQVQELASAAADLSDVASPLTDYLKEASIAIATSDKQAMNKVTTDINKFNSTTLDQKVHYSEVLPEFKKSLQQCQEDQ